MNPIIKELEKRITEKQAQAEELAQDIEDAFIYQAEELRQYSLTAWVLGKQVREYTHAKTTLPATNAREIAAGIESFTSDAHYLCSIARDTYNLTHLLRDIEKLRKEKGRQENANNR